jgi:predicted membrane protein
MAEKRQSPSAFWPLIIILLGFIFLLDNFGYLSFGVLVSRYWPVILILLGLRILWSRRGSAERQVQIFGVKDDKREIIGSADKAYSDSSTESEQVVENVFGDVRLNFQNKIIESFRASNVFGDFELDFSQASLKEQTTIQVSGVFGDINICLPANIYLQVQADYVAGSSRILDEYQSGLFKKIYFTTPESGKKQKTIQLKVSIIFGDIWIYNSAKG